MSTYKNLVGKDVNFLSTDPDNDAAEGQIWYNSTAGVFKDLIVSEAFSSSGPIGTARYSLGVAGTQTAGLLFAGDVLPGPSALTEEYNASGWTTGGNMSTARRSVGGFGTQTAAVVTGGNPGPTVTTATEEYDGSSWTAGGAIATGRRNIGSAGILTAGLAIGGYTGTAQSTSVEHYNGTSWTAGGAFPSGVSSNSGMGTQTAALSVGGNPGSQSINFKYDGSSWTALNPTNTVRANTQSGGDSALAVIMGGYAPSKTTATETWDGTNWSTSSATLATAKTQMGTGPVGSSIASFGAGGYTAPGITSGTEEFNRSINVITAGAWSAGGTIPYSSPQKNGSGILTAAFAVGGETPPGAMVNTSVKYDGTSWTATNNINSARGDVMAAGTLTAGLIMGGYQNTPDFLFEETEEFNGTSWSEVNDMPTGAYSGSGTGTQTAAFVNNMYIGSPGERTNVTYEYDGTNWSNGGNTAQTTNSRSSVGTLTAGLTVGGRPAPTTYIDKTELYDGTSWTSGVDMISIFQAGGQSSKGTQSDCIIFGSPKTPANTDAYKTDGTTWFTQPSMATSQNNGTGTSTAALAFGNSNTSVEFTGETSALNIKTITTS